jgi:response regulator RpfG family c-di-GMP phosphodiesterase
VDDNPQIRRLVARLLRIDGIEVLTAASTRAAERLLAGGPVELLLCDQLMPEENGLPFLQRMKKRYPDMMRVLVTGCGDAGVGVEAINKAQVQRCVTKPFEGAELRATVRALLDRPAMRTGSERAFTQQRVKALKHLDFDHPGIADVRRNTQGAIVITDDFDDLTKTFDDWAQFEDSREIKTHEDVLSEDFIKLIGT